MWNSTRFFFIAKNMYQIAGAIALWGFDSALYSISGFDFSLKFIKQRKDRNRF